MTDQTLMVTQKTQDQGDPRARRNAQDVLFLMNKLPPRMQAIFKAWLMAQSRGELRECSEEALTEWLAAMNPARLEAQQRLMVMEIAWLQFLVRDFLDLLAEDAQ